MGPVVLMQASFKIVFLHDLTVSKVQPNERCKTGFETTRYHLQDITPVIMEEGFMVA